MESFSCYWLSMHLETRLCNYGIDTHHLHNSKITGSLILPPFKPTALHGTFRHVDKHSFEFRGPKLQPWPGSRLYWHGFPSFTSDLPGIWGYCKWKWSIAVSFHILSILSFRTTHLPIISRYSDWLRVGRPRGRSSSPNRVKNFLFSTSSIPALGSTQPPIQWVPGALFPRVNRPGREADHSPPTSAELKKNVDLYIHSPLRLVELN
jgi:hypothetical protein